MKEILEFLKNGEHLDSEIADVVCMPLASVRILLSELTAKGELMSCHSIRFEKGKKVEGMKCRLAGFNPPAKPGRKSKVQLRLS